MQDFYTVAATMELIEETSGKSSNMINFSTLTLEPNEFNDYTDPVGYVEKEVEPKKFLTPGSLRTKDYLSEKLNDYRVRY